VKDEELIEAEARRLEISRLCHLTPLRNLLHVASGEGLKSVAELNECRDPFDQQDLDRLDKRPDHISCSIEYPNVWYLRRRRQGATPLQHLFPEWVCLLVNPRYLWRQGTEFAPRNASAAGGRLLRPGFDAFRDLYAAQVAGARGVTYGRSAKPPPCPTDDQAEVMVPKRIPLADANTVVLGSETQAANAAAALRWSGVSSDAFRFRICPEFFEVGLSAMLRRGRRPVETAWAPRVPDVGC
jgi:ssDNA thymidine ADP-ribosyltransferase, DarT